MDRSEPHTRVWPNNAMDSAPLRMEMMICEGDETALAIPAGSESGLDGLVNWRILWCASTWLVVVNMVKMTVKAFRAVISCVFRCWKVWLISLKPVRLSDPFLSKLFYGHYIAWKIPGKVSRDTTHFS